MSDNVKNLTNKFYNDLKLPLLYFFCYTYSLANVKPLQTHVC